MCIKRLNLQQTWESTNSEVEGGSNPALCCSGVAEYPLPFGKLSAGRTTKDLINAACGYAEKLQYSHLVRRSRPITVDQRRPRDSWHRVRGLVNEFKAQRRHGHVRSRMLRRCDVGIRLNLQGSFANVLSWRILGAKGQAGPR